jgi:hypothetical protein
MKCFEPCPPWKQRCRLKCPFGLKVDVSPCTTCQCADDPCLSTTCPRGSICTAEKYRPCAIDGKCGFIGKCSRDPSASTFPTTVKPKNCPDYWPEMRDGKDRLLQCNDSDSECPNDEKCCLGPPPFRGPPPDWTPVSYCAKPCDSIADCTLTCQLGLRVQGGCRVCECNVDPCTTTSQICPAGKRCRALPAPCYHYDGSPPCPLIDTCV